MARAGISILRRGTWLLSMLRRRRHIVNLLRLIWRLFLDRRVPLYLKGLLVVAVVYVLSPLDFIPAYVLLVIGVVDDFAIILLAANYFLRWAPREVIEDHIQTMDPDFQVAFRRGEAL